MFIRLQLELSLLETDVGKGDKEATDVEGYDAR
jgi:hypothetical protein